LQGQLAFLAANNEHTAPRRLWRVHSDMPGSQQLSIDGFPYFITFIDDFHCISRYTLPSARMQRRFAISMTYVVPMLEIKLILVFPIFKPMSAANTGMKRQKSSNLVAQRIFHHRPILMNPMALPNARIEH